MVSGVCPIANGNEQLDRLDFERYPTWVGHDLPGGGSTSSCDLSLVYLARKRSAT